ncbi:hypothetical protein JG688_00018022, partial [Phytophthora aleatoria]
RARVAVANPRGVPAKQGRAVFAKAGPAPSFPSSRSLHSPGERIFFPQERSDCLCEALAQQSS